MTTPRWYLSSIGARQHYAPARALHRRGRLARLYTDVWLHRGRGLAGHAGSLGRSLANRFHPELADAPVTGFTLAAMARRLRDSEAKARATSVEALYAHFERFGQWFGRRVAHDLRRRDLRGHAFFGFNTGCLECLPVCRDAGCYSVVDQIDPARTEERIVAEEAARWPGWAPAPGRIPDFYYDRLQREWAQADRVMVNSPWSRDALVEQGVPADKIAIIPLAFEAPAGGPPGPRPGVVDPAAPLHVVWIGSVNLRKGVPYVVEAARRVDPAKVRFTVAGPLHVAPEKLADAPGNITFPGRLTRDRTDALYRAGDVFLLPTLSDGFAITQLEAAARGLPLIVSPRCGQVVEHGVDGLVVPPADPQAIADAVTRFADDRDALAAMSTAAFEKSKQFSLDTFGRRVAALADAGGGESL